MWYTQAFLYIRYYKVITSLQFHLYLKEVVLCRGKECLSTLWRVCYRNQYTLYLIWVLSFVSVLPGPSRPSRLKFVHAWIDKHLQGESGFNAHFSGLTFSLQFWTKNPLLLRKVTCYFYNNF